MTIAHFSDTHLGYRAYGRTAPSGFNQREVDVMLTFRQCLDAIAGRDPDLVVHSGDFFHVVRPSNATIIGAFQSLSRFQAARKGKPFVLIGGNHDTPRIVESGNILKLFAEIPGLHIRTSSADFVDLPEVDTEVLCVPSHSLLRGENADLVPAQRRKYSVLTVHGLAMQAVPEAAQFDIADTRFERWTYVGLGDFHVHQAYGRNICYAGSTDFTSNNIWEEASVSKGWVWFDTDAARLESVPLNPRKVIDLPRIDAHELTPDQLAHAILENAKWNDEELPIVRQRVINVHPDTRARLGTTIVRDLNNRCLNYLLRLLPPERVASDGETKVFERITLERSWEEHMDSAVLPAGVERGAVKKLGLDLLQEVNERAAHPAQA